MCVRVCVRGSCVVGCRLQGLGEWGQRLSFPKKKAGAWICGSQMEQGIVHLDSWI